MKLVRHSDADQMGWGENNCYHRRTDVKMEERKTRQGRGESASLSRRRPRGYVAPVEEGRIILYNDRLGSWMAVKRNGMDWGVAC